MEQALEGSRIDLVDDDQILVCTLKDLEGIDNLHLLQVLHPHLYRDRYNPRNIVGI